MANAYLHLAMTCALICPASAQVSVLAGAEERPARAKYEELNRRIHNAKEQPSEAEYEEITTQLRAIMTQRMNAFLSHSDDSDGLRKTIAGVQGEFALSTSDPGVTNTPFVERFQIFGQPGLTVAFVIVRGGSGIPDTLPVLQFYTKEWGEWKLRAETDTDFHGCTFMVSSLDSPVLGESWWLAWGQRYGDTGARRKVRLYAFDGETVKTVWQRDDLLAGSISVAKDRKTIVLEYYRKVGTPEQPRPDLRIREEWYLTPNGPQQASSVIAGDAGSIGTTPQ
jgi:hypothetical protein